MALPAFEWLRRQLGGVDQVSGGWKAKTKHPVMAGSGFLMSALFVAMWLLALVPLGLWAGGKRLRQRARVGENGKGA